MNLIIKKYNFGDEYKILRLFYEVFNKEMKLEYWRWRYNRSDQIYINSMWDDENLAGHYALFPVEVVYKGKTLKTGFSMTTMTSNKYGKLGIFKTLADDLYFSAYNDLKVIWGFPNNNSLHGFVKYLEWSHLFDIDMLTIDLDLKIKTIQSSNKHINKINEFSEEYNYLFSRIASKYEFIVSRDKDYLNWRFVKNPQYKYYILEYREANILHGYCVYKMYINKGINYGDIVDILATNKTVFEELILEAISNIKKQQANYANIWMIDDEYRNILFDIGFTQSKNTTHFGMRNNGEVESLNNIQKFYLTMSDSDVF